MEEDKGKERKEELGRRHPHPHPQENIRSGRRKKEVGFRDVLG